MQCVCVFTLNFNEKHVSLVKEIQPNSCFSPADGFKLIRTLYVLYIFFILFLMISPVRANVADSLHFLFLCLFVSLDFILYFSRSHSATRTWKNPSAVRLTSFRGEIEVCNY